MRELVARKYVLALLQSCSSDELNLILEKIKFLSSLNALPKFTEIIHSPFVSEQAKIDLLLDLLDHPSNQKLINFIKILAENQRLDLFSELFVELSSFINMKHKKYSAYLISSETYSEEKLKEIEEKYNQQFNVKLSLEYQKTDVPGVRLVVEGLGIEISFTQEKFVSDLKHHILKSF